MKPFTDEDLKRLEEAITRINVTSFGITMTPDEWNSLLHRLEAAEHCIRECQFFHCQTEEDEMKGPIGKWLKASGKEPK